jgi:ABC transport system ATP-binding/permease protein
MWKLTIEDDEGSQTALQLAAAEYHIGRDEGNNVRLTDRNVSRRHATIKRNGDETWHLVDHESYNGSYVNGQRVAGSSSLGHADLIQLGDYRIFLTNEERVLAPPSPGKPATSSVRRRPSTPTVSWCWLGPSRASSAGSIGAW